MFYREIDEIKAGADVKPAARAGGRAVLMRCGIGERGEDDAARASELKKTRARYCFNSGTCNNLRDPYFSHPAIAVAIPELGRVGRTPVHARIPMSDIRFHGQTGLPHIEVALPHLEVALPHLPVALMRPQRSVTVNG